MRVVLPKEIASRIIAELKSSGRKEIGGILMGEHVADDEFRVCDITIQKIKGGFAFFERIVESIIEPLKKFFIRTNKSFQKFNYMGEWHSHPSFRPYPSTIDHATMQELIEDINLGANFLVLLIVRLGLNGDLEGTVTIYRSKHEPHMGSFEIN